MFVGSLCPGSGPPGDSVGSLLGSGLALFPMPAARPPESALPSQMIRLQRRELARGRSISRERGEAGVRRGLPG